MTFNFNMPAVNRQVFVAGYFDKFRSGHMREALIQACQNISPVDLRRELAEYAPEKGLKRLMETRSHVALPPITPRLRFQVWVKGITPPSSSITNFPIFRRAISPTDGSNAPVSEVAPDLSPKNSAPAHLCLSQAYKVRTSIAR